MRAAATASPWAVFEPKDLGSGTDAGAGTGVGTGTGAGAGTGIALAQAQAQTLRQQQQQQRRTHGWLALTWLSYRSMVMSGGEGEGHLAQHASHEGEKADEQEKGFDEGRTQGWGGNQGEQGQAVGGSGQV